MLRSPPSCKAKVMIAALPINAWKPRASHLPCSQGTSNVIPSRHLSQCRWAQLSQRRQGRTPLICQAAAAVAEAETAAAPSGNGKPKAEVLSHASFDAGLDVQVAKQNGHYKVIIAADQPRSMVLHWAVNDWNLAPQSAWPQGTQQIDDKAVQTPFEGGQRVELTFPEEQCPSRVVWVLKELEPENWVNNGGTDFAVQLKAPDVQDVIQKVLTAEGTYDHWSLFNRFIMANDILDAADAAGPEGMSFMLVWLRLSTMKQLDWYRNSSYQSKDIAHVQKTITQRFADKARSSSDPWCRYFARLTAAGLPRGGGDGDAIRHGILNVMRENGIKEGHRPGIECHFLEAWHQKLHTNTTPEDVTVCEAYLAFLHSGNMDDYWRTLWDNGRITREAITSKWDRKIPAEPTHLPHLIGPMKHYLWILKTTHGGQDMDTCLEMAKGSLDGELQWMCYDMLSNRNEWWVPGKLVDIRQRLEPYWRAPGASRDVLLLDIALDNYFRLCVERMDKSSLQGDDLLELVSLVLRNACIASENQELGQCLAHVDKIRGQERWSREWGLRALAAAQRVQLGLLAFADTIYGLVQPHAASFKPYSPQAKELFLNAGREACKLDEKYIVNFGEEIVRGQPVFMLSILLQCLDPILRQTAGVAPWQIVSQADASGEIMVKSLASVQGQSFDKPTVLITEEVGGMEDIPENVTAVLTRSPVDVLSHVAIRARSQGVFLATCFDEGQMGGLLEQQGQYVMLTINASGSVEATPVDASAQQGSKQGSSALPPLNIPKPKKTQAWALVEYEFEEGLVGGKAGNLAKLRGKLPAGVQAPASVTLPFGTFERVLAHESNKGVASAVAKAQKELAAAKAGSIPPALAQLRSLVASQLQAPAELQQEAVAKAEGAGLITSGEWGAGSSTWETAWGAICKVWASKWNDRAWLSRRARGVAEGDLFMSCLLQQVVPAEYAFVVHTANPITKERGEVFGELVVGMGEALVGNYPGRALSFSLESGKANADVRLASLPSKRLGLFAAQPSLIARSDSNGEDLEAFAGAGLYDSVPLVPLREQTLDYTQAPVVWDWQFQQDLLRNIANVGVNVEEAFGGVPQDIEGVYSNEALTIVQSRPQVL